MLGHLRLSRAAGGERPRRQGEADAAATRSLLAFFGARASDDTRYTKYLIEDETRLRYRFYPSACTRRWVLQNRDINHLFAGLEIFDSLLLKSGVREILFRRPL